MFACSVCIENSVDPSTWKLKHSFLLTKKEVVFQDMDNSINTRVREITSTSAAVARGGSGGGGLDLSTRELPSYSSRTSLRAVQNRHILIGTGDLLLLYTFEDDAAMLDPGCRHA